MPNNYASRFSRANALLHVAIPLAAIPGVFLAVPAYAQAADESGLEDIVVTAQRTAERLQDVPIAISAISATAATATGLTDTRDLNGRVPSLNVMVRGPSNLIFLRGVGSLNSAPNAEASVATYVDGVYMFSVIGNQYPFNNIERIEVLKGPQGTLFGRNATGGVVQIITKDPSYDFGGHFDVGYGNYESLKGNFYVTGGLSGNIAMDFAAFGGDQGKGYGKSITNGQRVGWSDDISLRSKLLFTPNESTRITAALAYSWQKTAGYHVRPRYGVRSIDGITYTRDMLDPQDTPADSRNRFTAKSWLGSFKIEQDFDFAKLVSISAYHKVDAKIAGDTDGGRTKVVQIDLIMPIKNVSQEIQLIGNRDADPKLTWMLGAYYFNADGSYNPLAISGAAAGTLGSIETFGRQHLDSFSVFGQGSYELFERTNFTAGIRHTWEKVYRRDARQTSKGVLLRTFPDRALKYNEFTWRLSLDHKFGDDVLAYISYNRGLKAGGYNLSSPQFDAFQPEKLDAYEAGMKAELFDHRLRFNAAAFLYKFKNLQLNVLTAVGTNFTTNAANATMKGFDADVSAIPVHNLTVYGGIGYVNGKYDKFPNAVGYPAVAGAAIPFDAAGKRTINTPDWSGNLGFTYLIPSSVGEFSFDAQLLWSNFVYVQPTNRSTLPRYKVVNTSLSWKDTDSRWGARLWAKNLFDEKYLGSALELSTGDVVIYAPPRTFGLSVSLDF